MLAWVTGATGFVGSALTRKLCSQGHEVVALVRPSSRRRSPEGARVVVGALPDVSGLLALPPPDVVFHCAAAIDGNHDAGHALHVDGTLRLAEASRGGRFVHVSTTDVFPITSRVPLTESAPCSPHDAYGRTKLQGERALLAARPDAVVLRPPGIYGPHSTRDVVLHMATRIQRGTYFHFGDGNARRSWIFVETLIDALLHAAASTTLRGVYLVDDGEPVSRRELATEISRALGRGAGFPAVPGPVLNAAAWLCERALPPLGLRPPLTTESVRYATTPLPLDTCRWRSTGFRPRFTRTEAIEATLSWGRATGLLRA